MLIQCFLVIGIGLLVFSLLLITFAPGRYATYCDQRVFMCLFVCLSVRSHISTTTRLNFTRFSVHVTRDRGSVVL